jgi:hypothetical protein
MYANQTNVVRQPRTKKINPCKTDWRTQIEKKKIKICELVHYVCFETQKRSVIDFQVQTTRRRKATKNLWSAKLASETKQNVCSQGIKQAKRNKNIFTKKQNMFYTFVSFSSSNRQKQ